MNIAYNGKHIQEFQAIFDKKIANILREVAHVDELILFRIFNAMKSFMYFLVGTRKACNPKDDFVNDFLNKLRCFIRNYESGEQTNDLKVLSFK